MTRRLYVMLLLVGLLSIALSASIAAQSALPRTPWGDPDLSGAWTNTTMTPLQRPEDLADKEFLTGEELAVRQREVFERSSFDNRPRSQFSSYNEFWMERGVLNNRTSLVIDPSTGRLPSQTPREQERRSRQTRSFDSWLDLNTLDRCITRGLPGAMMPGFYNHNYQIVQSEDYVAILVEMVHEARIVPLDGRAHLDSHVRQWLGDSRGRWEGDTLVIETTNFNGKATGRGGTTFGGDQYLHVVERLTRVDRNTIDYEITVTDPTIWTEAWTVSIPMQPLDGAGAVFEYACHEGNYGLENILAGAREEEREAAGQE